MQYKEKQEVGFCSQHQLLEWESNLFMGSAYLRRRISDKTSE